MGLRSNFLATILAFVTGSSPSYIPTYFYLGF